MSPSVITKPSIGQLTRLCLCLQSVTCPTCLNKTIDLCYSNIPDSFRALCRPALGRSDHNFIHLVPKYRQLGKLDKNPGLTLYESGNTTTKETLRGALIALIGRCFVMAVLIMLMKMLTLSRPVFSFVNKM